MHPHLVAPSLTPEAWCCPQTLEWTGRQGSCNTGWAGGGTETRPRCPVAGWDGWKGPCWPRWVQTEVSAVYTWEGQGAPCPRQHTGMRERS